MVTTEETKVDTPKSVASAKKSGTSGGKRDEAATESTLAHHLWACSSTVRRLGVVVGKPGTPADDLHRCHSLTRTGY